ncbi:MAG TPA: T9SS type A sorting domain-containing protein [Candidatus Krumholzibacteria bacterium]|nr:T9SS type A sorting domain-containing protein [Candidatus Krumholzibacteria bacterium]
MKLIHVVAATTLLVATLATPGRCTTWHVPGDKATIQAAFDVASSGDIIVLADGVFSGPGNSTASLEFATNGRITLTSEHGRDYTTVDFMGAAGIAIFAPNKLWCDVSGIKFINPGGLPSGLLVGWSFATPGQTPMYTYATVRDCAIDQFLVIRASTDGRGFVLNNQLSGCLVNPAVSKVIVEGNTGSGRVYTAGDSVGINNNTLTGMSGDAIIACENGSPTVVRIQGNQVNGNITNRGISVVPSSVTTLDMDVSGNTVMGNADAAGPSRAAIFVIVPGTISSATVHDNIAGQNGVPGLLLAASGPTVPTIVVSSNTFSENAGGVELDAFSPVGIDFHNNIVAFSTTGIGVTCTGDVTLACNDIYGNPGGDAICGIDGGGNFSRDPVFCGNLGSGNYALRDISPCAPGNHPYGAPCGLIGALGVACSNTPDICWHVDDFSGLYFYSPLVGTQSLWCGARPSASPPFNTYLSLPGYGNDWNVAFESIEFPTAGNVTVQYKAMWDLVSGDNAWLEYLDKTNTWVPFPTLPSGLHIDVESVTIPSSELAGRVKLRFRFQSDSSGSDEDGTDTYGAVVLDSLVVSDTVLGVLDYQSFEPETMGATATADGHWYCANPPTVVPTTTPAQFALFPAFPNPFNPSTTIRYSIGRAADVSLVVYDVAGRQVRVLVDQHRSPGTYESPWDGRDSRGNPVASGVYFYRLHAGTFTDTKKMVLLK